MAKINSEKMKKLFILMLILTFHLSIMAQDQPAIASEKNVIKLNTLSLLVGTGSVFYERRITDMISGQLGVSYMDFSLFTDTKFSGLIINPECKFYIRKNAIDGFYFSPYLRYHRFAVENKEESSSGSLSSFGGGVAFGRQWIYKKGFVFDLFFGGHYGKSKVKVDSGTDSFDKDLFNGFKIRAGAAIGFAF